MFLLPVAQYMAIIAATNVGQRRDYRSRLLLISTVRKTSAPSALVQQGQEVAGTCKSLHWSNSGNHQMSELLGLGSSNLWWSSWHDRFVETIGPFPG